MYVNTIEIGDSSGHSFLLRIWGRTKWEDWVGGAEGWRWEVIEFGCLTVKEGVSYTVKGRPESIILYTPEAWNVPGSVIIQLDDYPGHDQGTGTINQSFVLNFNPGPIFWRQITAAQLVARRASKVAQNGQSPSRRAADAVSDALSRTISSPPWPPTPMK